MAANIDQPGEKLKRTIAAAIAAVTAGTSMWLAASAASAATAAGAASAATAAGAAGVATAAGATAARPGSPGPSATLRVVPGWTYQDGGKLAVIAGCSQRGDVRVINSNLLPRPVRMSKGKNLLIKLIGKTKPGKYAIALLCEDKHQVPDSVDVKSVRIYTVLGAFQQPDQPLLPDHFRPDATVSAGPPPAAAHPKKKGH